MPQAKSIAAAIAIFRDADAFEWIWLIGQRLGSTFGPDSGDQFSGRANLARAHHRGRIRLRLVSRDGVVITIQRAAKGTLLG